MLTGENGILSNANTASSSSVYYGAEEQVKLAYMSVRTEIMAQTVANSSYDATTAENTGEVGRYYGDNALASYSGLTNSESKKLLNPSGTGHFWLGSSNSSNANNVHNVNTNGNINNNNFNNYGVRPAFYKT